jgi:phytoene synthase
MVRLTTPFTDLQACRVTLSHGSRSFWLASQLLSPALKNAACGLYAFCREADDLIDEGDDPIAALEALTERLDAIYQQRPHDHSIDRILAQVVSDHQLPRPLLDALLEGFAWDNTSKRYADMSALRDYAARVAGTVGVMMAVLMGIRAPHTLARAADLGVAMQLTNIARDVVQDAHNGRLYLPINELEAGGIDVNAFLLAPDYNETVGSVVRSLLEEASMLYRRADSGINELPANCRRGIYAARLLYAKIGEAVLVDIPLSFERRTVVNPRQKFQQLTRALTGAPPSTELLRAESLPECQFLVDIAATAGHATQSYLALSAPQVAYQRITWLLDAVGHLNEQGNDRSKAP